MTPNASDPAAVGASRAVCVLQGTAELHAAYSTEPPKKLGRRSVPRTIFIRPVTGGFSVAVEPHPTIRKDAVGFNRRLGDVGAARQWAAEVHALKGWGVSDLTGAAVAADPVIVPLEDLDENHRVVHDVWAEIFARDAFRDARKRP